MSTLLEEYQRDGIVVVRDLIAREALDVVIKEIAAIFEGAAHSIGLDLQYDTEHVQFSRNLVELFRTNRDVFLGATKQTQFLLSANRLGLSSEFDGVLSSLGITLPTFSTRLVIIYMANDLRIEGGYHKTPIHQDWRSVQGSLDGVVAWLPLFDVGLMDYPLEVVIGSHLRGLLPSVEDVFGHRIADGIVEEDSFSSLVLERGDVAFFSGFLVHRTGNQGGAACRIALSFRYNNAAEASFVRRNYPSPYVYRPDMRLLTENFPSGEDIDRTFRKDQ